MTSNTNWTKVQDSLNTINTNLLVDAGLEVTGQLTYRHPVVALVDAAAAGAIRSALQVHESGTIFTVPALTTGTQTLTLPALSSSSIGCTFTFVSVGTVGQDFNIGTPSTGKIVGNVPKGDGDNVAIASGFDTIGFDANAVLGTRFTLTCISTTAGVAWILSDVVDALAANTGSLNLA
jgi:hypothetical protein